MPSDTFGNKIRPAFRLCSWTVTQMDSCQTRSVSIPSLRPHYIASELQRRRFRVIDQADPQSHDCANRDCAVCEKLQPGYRGMPDGTMKPRASRRKADTSRLNRYSDWQLDVNPSVFPPLFTALVQR